MSSAPPPPYTPYATVELSVQGFEQTITNGEAVEADTPYQPPNNNKISRSTLVWTAIYQALVLCIFQGQTIAMFYFVVHDFSALTTAPARDFSEPIVFVVLLFIISVICSIFTLWQYYCTYTQQTYAQPPVSVADYLASFLSAGTSAELFKVFSMIFIPTLVIWMWVMIGNKSQVDWFSFRDQFATLATLILIYAISYTAHLVWILALTCVYVKDDN